MIHDTNPFQFIVDETDNGRRFDALIALRISNCSRSFATALISKGEIRVQGLIKKPGYRVKVGDKIDGRIPPPQAVVFKPEPIDLDIIYEDDHFIILNKQPGLVVHPAPGHYSGTLVNGLLYHYPDLKGFGGDLRPGIVHRLDKDTSGVLIIAKDGAAHQQLAWQFKSRKIKKEYLALVHGEVTGETGTILLPVGRHPADRKRMSTHSAKGRDAETEWRVRERFSKATWLELDLKTGRTHQIRVHLAAIRHPVIGDPVYGKRQGVKKQENEKAASPKIESPLRLMLHAWRIRFAHPVTQQIKSFEAPVPEDMRALADTLRRSTAK